MKSIVYPGIFTSHGFLAAVFVAFGLSLIFKAVNKQSEFARSDKKLYVAGGFSVLLGLVFSIMYVMQIKSIVA